MASELEAVCNLNSGSDSLDGLLRVAEWLVDYFAPLGGALERISLPTFERLDDEAIVSTHTTGPAFRWNFPGSHSGKKGRILLSIHYDTVYGPSSPFQKCERYDVPLSGGDMELRMRGPGVIDAKGGIVVLRWGVMAALKFLDLSQLDLSIVLTPDEEIGSPSSIALWNQIAPEFDFAMLYEPTLADGTLVSHRKGTGTFVVVVYGKAAHSGRNFQDGRNAIVCASKLAVALDSLNGQRPEVTINVGRVRGGNAVNVVPDLAVLRVNVRVSSHTDMAWLENKVRETVQAFQNPEAGFLVELHGGLQAAPKVQDSATTHWMSVVESAAAALSEKVQWRVSGGASDGNKLAALGLSNIDTFGPEGDLLHSGQEWVRLSSLPRKAALTASMLSECVKHLQFAGG